MRCVYFRNIALLCCVVALAVITAERKVICNDSFNSPIYLVVLFVWMWFIFPSWMSHHKVRISGQKRCFWNSKSACTDTKRTICWFMGNHPQQTVVTELVRELVVVCDNYHLSIHVLLTIKHVLQSQHCWWCPKVDRGGGGKFLLLVRGAMKRLYPNIKEKVR